MSSGRLEHAAAPASLPFLGHGVGLRVPHYERALAGELDVDWVEVISENFFGGGGRPRAVLERLRRDHPLVFHGVSLGVGSVGVPGARYLGQLAELAQRFEPAWLSDHLCWGHWEGQFSHELLPLPYTEEALAHVVQNVQRVQEALRRPILLENVSSYVAFAHSQLPEWQFLSEVAQRSGCLLLLDLNNILVSAFNHGFSPEQYLEGVPAERVQQLHLANHSELPGYRFDDHRGPVPEAVWQLYESACRRFGAVSSCVEWDEEVPSWEELRAEQRQAVARGQRALGERAAASAAPAAAVLPRALPDRLAGAGAQLAETQALFFRAITWPTGVGAFLAQADASTRAEFEQSFVGRPGLSSVERVDVYANSYFYRLLAALRELFPRVDFLCGDAQFHNLITDYVLACPPRDPDLRQLGQRLPGFMREHALGRRWPVLGDVAALERALNAALDAVDGPLLGAAELAAVPLERWPELRFALSPPSQLLESRWDLERLERCRAEGQREAALELLPAAPRCLIVGRRGHATFFRTATRLEECAAPLLFRGEHFAGVCATLERAGLEPGELVLALQRWLADGMIAGASA